jgi:MSHA biogenesis protein MshJ
MELGLRNRLQPWLDRIDALELRERILLMVAGIAVIFLLVDNLWLQPTLKAQHTAEKHIADLEVKLNSLQQNARLLADGTGSEPLESRRKNREQLRSQLAELDARIVRKLGVLVEPAQAAQVLRQLLRAHKGLKLVTLSASAEPLDDAGDGSGAGLARYQVAMVVKGSYLSVMDYLQSLEKLPWKFFWQQVDFQSKKYPDAETRLQLYTLGAGHA